MYINTAEPGYRPPCQHVRAAIKDTPPGGQRQLQCSVSKLPQLLVVFNEAFEVLAKWAKPQLQQTPSPRVQLPPCTDA